MPYYLSLKFSLRRRQAGKPFHDGPSCPAHSEFEDRKPCEARRKAQNSDQINPLALLIAAD
jgi:hypothetical protein